MEIVHNRPIATQTPSRGQEANPRHLERSSRNNTPELSEGGLARCRGRIQEDQGSVLYFTPPNFTVQRTAQTRTAQTAAPPLTLDVPERPLSLSGYFRFGSIGSKIE